MCLPYTRYRSPLSRNHRLSPATTGSADLAGKESPLPLGEGKREAMHAEAYLPSNREHLIGSTDFSRQRKCTLKDAFPVNAR